MAKRAEYRIEPDGQTVSITKGISVNRQPAVLEVRFNTITKAGRYTVKLVKGGYTVASDGGMEWDALARLLRKYAIRVGEPEKTLPCGACGKATLYRIDVPHVATWDGQTVKCIPYLCASCGRVWEGEFERL